MILEHDRSLPQFKSSSGRRRGWMPTAKTNETTPRKIAYLSPPAEVSMADRWFEIASTDHFWVRRRFDVLQRLAGDSIASAKEMA
jgi:hypothetical protein